MILNLFAKTPKMSARCWQIATHDADLDQLIALDTRWRENLTHTQSLKAHQNQVSQQIAERKKSKLDASETIAEMRELSQKIKELTAENNDTKSRDRCYSLDNSEHA